MRTFTIPMRCLILHLNVLEQVFPCRSVAQWGLGGPMKRHPDKVDLCMASQMQELCGLHVYSARHNVAMCNDRRNWFTGCLIKPCP